MSQTPLLSQSGPAADQETYGTLPTRTGGSRDNVSLLSKGLLDDVRKRDSRKTSASESSTSIQGIQGLKERNPAINCSGEDGGTFIDRESTDEDENPSDNSRYQQVRASVSAKDNVTASISTPRMWILSLLCALLGSATNLFFSLRYPSVAVTPIIALVVVHPLGLAWDHLFKRDNDPIEIFEYGQRIKQTMDEGSNPVSALTRTRRWFAQGRWNEKEHACVYISSNVSFGFAFATDVGATAFSVNPTIKPVNVRREEQLVADS